MVGPLSNDRYEQQRHIALLCLVKMLVSSVLLQLTGLHVLPWANHTSHESEAHIVTWHASMLGEIRFWRTMESISSEEEISQASKGGVSLASAYPLKCMEVDAQHFHGSRPI